jgi:hypothetical protein
MYITWDVSGQGRTVWLVLPHPGHVGLKTVRGRIVLDGFRAHFRVPLNPNEIEAVCRLGGLLLGP